MAARARSGCLLIVEDERSHSDLLTMLLESEGFHTVCEPDGMLALTLARALRPAAITLDLELPGLDGRAVLAALKAEPSTAPIPVVVVSAHADLLGPAKRASAFAVLRKPFDLDALVAAVRRASARPA